MRQPRKVRSMGGRARPDHARAPGNKISPTHTQRHSLGFHSSFPRATRTSRKQHNEPLAMPLHWFRRTRPVREDDKQKAIETTPTTWHAVRPKRAHRSHSQGSGLRAIIGLASVEREVAAARAVEEDEHRRLVYQSKTRRRFTVHGTAMPPPHALKHVDAPAGSPPPRLGAVSPTYASRKHYGMSSSRLVHGRSPRVPLMQSPGPDFHPSIIFIDCPP
ncbi:hypothetical protein PsorP6_010405 [Peronosclerospora sorghi]|uniref:Uncharacterized protein n=1 Tax=Peronosclerospora sorghi TaxID=230839 RepID=A0ACC0VVQ4_9STRA|nr:hypothetical protein PsorP6_010405 [Peronosclerospora sorghi]